MAKVKDWSGQKYGKLTFIKPFKKASCGAMKWELKCDCGAHVKMLPYKVANGRYKQCNRYCGLYIDNMKRCSLCNEYKNIDAFYKSNRRNKQSVTSHCKCCETKKSSLYYKNNKENLNLKQSQWIKSNPEKILEYGAKSRAKLNNICYNLTNEDFIIPDYCPVLGIPLSRSENVSSDNSPTVDRINPKLGYVKGNTMIISFRANSIKRDGTAEEHEAIAAYIKANLTSG